MSKSHISVPLAPATTNPVPSLSTNATCLTLPTLVAGNEWIKLPPPATVQSVTARRWCAMANMLPSVLHAAATGVECRWERAARQAQEVVEAGEAEVGAQSLMDPSAEVVRRRGDLLEGENAMAVMGASCGLSMRVERTNPLPDPSLRHSLSCLTGANPSRTHESTVAIQYPPVLSLSSSGVENATRSTLVGSSGRSRSAPVTRFEGATSSSRTVASSRGE